MSSGDDRSYQPDSRLAWCSQLTGSRHDGRSHEWRLKPPTLVSRSASPAAGDNQHALAQQHAMQHTS